MSADPGSKGAADVQIFDAEPEPAAEQERLNRVLCRTTQPLDIEYPESDGQPMGENTLQFQWIVTIEGGLEAMFSDNGSVFIAGDLFWYPVEGDPGIRAAPDIMVVFGRPKGHRRSYLQWKEGNVTPQVVFEIRSPGNRFGELLNRFSFYQRYGVEEYYLYDPDFNELEGWVRSGAVLEEISNMNGWTSPRLGVRFVLEHDSLTVYRPDGRRLSTYVEVEREREQERQLRLSTEAQLERLRVKLRELGIDPEK